uniref:Uncharacterized protein n=1 Tax=Oryza meridionalis TaxID=40149 RepID=A0A0E0C1J9_9ORYZ
MKTLSVPEVSSSKKLSDEVTQSSEASEEESDEDMKEPITRLSAHGFLSLMISAVGNYIIPLLTSHSKPEQTAKRSAMPIAVFCLGTITLVIGNGMRFRIFQPKQQYGSGVALHITTAGIVLNSYVFLLLINTRYISLVVFPVIMIVFIGALCRKFWKETCRRQFRHESPGASKASSVLRKSEEQLTLIVAVLPFWLQLPGVMLARATWQQDRVLVSHFLVFISSTMVALATLIARTVPAGIYPGVSRVLPVMHKACIALILVSVHTMAGEWFGTKSMALACTPELVALLIWFSVHLNHAHDARACKIICLVAVSLLWAWAATYDAMTILQGYWRSSFWGISGLSGGLCYFSSWILKQWPKDSFRPTSDHHAPLLLQLLRISAEISLFTSVPSIALQLPRWVRRISAQIRLLASVPITALQLARWVSSKHESLMSVSTISVNVLMYCVCFLSLNNVDKYHPGMSTASISRQVLQPIMLFVLPSILISHFTGK